MAAQKKYYDQKHRDVQFAVGDSVLLSTQNLRLKGILHKLQWKFCGPYKALECIGTQAYHLKLPDTWRIHPMFHVSLLKPWRSSTVQQVLGDVELEEADQPQYFDIEKILWCGGIRRPASDDASFWSCGKGILSRRLSGFPRHFSVIQTHSKRMFVLAGFLRSSNLCSVFEDRNFSRGGRSCGKSWS